MLKFIKLMGNDRNSPLTLRIVVSSRFSYRIIGSHGSVHQAIQSQCDVQLNLTQDHDDQIGRLCSISGTVPNIARALKEIVCAIFKNNPSRIWINLLIPSALASKLQQIPATTGDGCILNDIAHETNTRITIEPTPIPNTTEHVLKVSIATTTKDYLDNFVQAMILIGHQFQIHRREALSPNNIYYTPFCQYHSPINNSDDEGTGAQDEQHDDRKSSTDLSPATQDDPLKDDSVPLNTCSNSLPSSSSSPSLPFSPTSPLDLDN